MKSFLKRARIARFEELNSPLFRKFMEALNDFAKPLGLQEYRDFSKNWEYPWIWFNGLEKRVGKGVNLLDIGSELSPMPWFLASLGAAVTLREVNPELTAHWDWIRKELKAKVDWEIGEGCDLPFPSRSFDIVTSFSVIEHQKEKEKAVKEVIRVLRPGGLFALSFDICETGMSMSYPEWGGSALTPDEFERKIWSLPEWEPAGSPLNWNAADIPEFLKWHRTTSPHHNYVVGAALLEKER